MIQSYAWMFWIVFLIVIDEFFAIQPSPISSDKAGWLERHFEEEEIQWAVLKDRTL